jgi:hypothetical protein
MIWAFCVQSSVDAVPSESKVRSSLGTYKYTLYVRHLQSKSKSSTSNMYHSLFSTFFGPLTVKSRLPQNTIPAPIPSSAFHSFPNHHTLKQRLIALRAVRTRFVDTDETCC